MTKKKTWLSLLALDVLYDGDDIHVVLPEHYRTINTRDGTPLGFFICARASHKEASLSMPEVNANRSPLRSFLVDSNLGVFTGTKVTAH